MQMRVKTRKLLRLERVTPKVMTTHLDQRGCDQSAV